MQHPNRIALACTLLACLAGRSGAAWSHLGNPVCTAAGAQHDPVSAAPWIAWTDDRHGPPQAYATSLSWSSGLATPPDGFRVAPSAFAQTGLVARASDFDLSGYLAWSEDRGTGSGADIYLMRCANGGPAAGWPAGGVRVCGAAGEQTSPRIALYGRHAFVSWVDGRDGSTALYVSDIAPDATRVPGWPADGLALDAGSGPIQNGALEPLVDPVDSLYVGAAWTRGGRVTAQIVAAHANVPAFAGWPATGRILSDPAYVATALAGRAIDVITSYGSAGMLLAWIEDRGGVRPIRSQGVNGNGSLYGFTPVEAESDSFAVPVSITLQPVQNQDEVSLIWRDQRSDGGDLYRQTIRVPRCCPFASGGPDGAPFVIKAGTQQLSSGAFYEDDAGVPQVWTAYSSYFADGERMAPSSWTEIQPSTSVAVGGYIPEDPPQPVVVWTDMRNAATAPDLYAQVLGPGGPGTVGVEGFSAPLSLEPAVPDPARGAVRVVLSLPRASDVAFDVVDLAGRRVHVLETLHLPAGRSGLEWDGRDAAGASVRPGLYWARVQVGGRTLSRRVAQIAR